MSTMLNPNAIPDGSITSSKIEPSVLEGKQNAITDLDTIRSGASKGATALQSYTESDPIYTADKPSLALKATTIAGYGITDAYTKTEVDNAIAAAITTTLNTAV